MEYLQKHVGNRIRRLRQQCHLTQDELAFKSGLHRSHIGGIERGETNVCLHTLAILSMTLNVPPHEFFKNIGVPKLKAESKKTRSN